MDVCIRSLLICTRIDLYSFYWTTSLADKYGIDNLLSQYISSNSFLFAFAHFLLYCEKWKMSMYSNVCSRRIKRFDVSPIDDFSFVCSTQDAYKLLSQEMQKLCSLCLGQKTKISQRSMWWHEKRLQQKSGNYDASSTTNSVESRYRCEYGLRTMSSHAMEVK